MAAATYERTLATGRNAWWLRGAMGRVRGAAFLRQLFALSSLAGSRSIDERMRAAARAKAAALVGAPRGGVVFAGSSTFTYWLALERDMHAAGVGNACINAGFGGACARHVLGAVDELVLPLRPRVVVFFAGTNDLNLGGSALEAAAAFVDLVARVRAALPLARIVFLSASVTPFVRARGEALVQAFGELNAAAREFAASPAAGGAVEVVESGAFQSDEGSYLGDNHHLAPEGHAALARLLAPAILRALEAAPP